MWSSLDSSNDNSYCIVVSRQGGKMVDLTVPKITLGERVVMENSPKFEEVVFNHYHEKAVLHSNIKLGNYNEKQITNQDS